MRAEEAGLTELPVVMAPEPEPAREAGAQQEAEAFGGGGVPRGGTEQAAERNRRDEEWAAREALRVQAAAAELERRREESEASRSEEGRSALPGMAGMALELLVGSMRLARAVVMAPLRLGLAFLDRSA